MADEAVVWTAIGILAAATYYAVFRALRAPGLWRMFLKTYVPPERHGDQRLRLAFVCYNLALFLWFFRVWAFIADRVFVVIPETDLVQLTDWVLGVVYATAIIGAAIFIPYVRKRVELLEQEEVKP